VKHSIVVVVGVSLLAGTASADLPMGLKCEKAVKIVGADIGREGKYEVQMGMKKEEHRAILERKKATAIDGCHYTGLVPGQILVVRYGGPEVGEAEVQCIDQNNNNAVVEFPKSIYTVRNANVSPWMLMPFCPDGKSKDDYPCSKLNTQSERATFYKETVLKANAKEKDRLHKIDLTFDPPYRDSVPSGAKLFCALINRDGNVIIAGTAQYPVVAAAADGDGEAADGERSRSRTRERPARP
jgi:hypothetical protein